MDEKETTVRKCSFAWPGTYGHECGAPSVVVVVKAAQNTSDGLFYTGRCADCLKIKGGENTDILRTEPEEGQANRWDNGYSLRQPQQNLVK